jgi:prepilin signal peptidase PulO-like enzyme (type II secretory pathway)
MIYLAAALRFWPEAVSAGLRGAFQLQTVYFIFGFLILNELIDFYIENKDVLKIPLSKLKPQMVLTAASLGKLREFAPALEINSDGLTEEDTGIIKDLGERNPKLRFAEIYKAMPLAPFIFLGAILTFILKGAAISSIL